LDTLHYLFWVVVSAMNPQHGHAKALDPKRIQNVVVAAGENGRGGWIRTNAWRDQNPLPYRLATPL
jgi:hypothetical protein